MHIVLNGERRELAGPRSVRALLDELGIDARVVAVEVNRAVIRRDRHDETILSDGAEVEIVAFVGGGSSLVRREPRTPWGPFALS
jgi:thiamine biosynthesis protein ThiS